MRMLLTDLLMRSTQLLHMIGGRDQCTVYFQLLHIPVLGPGNSGGGGLRSVVFRNMSSLNMTIHVYAPVDHVHCIKG